MLGALQERDKTSWEQTRLICRVVVGAFTGSDFSFPLPWDDDTAENDTPTVDDVENLRQMAKIFEKAMNNG